MLKFGEVRKYFGIFILSVMIIAVYKTFDSIGMIFSWIARFVSVLSPIYIAFVIAFLMYPLCYRTEVFIEDYFPSFFSERARLFSVVTVYVLVAGVVAGVLYILVPTLAGSFVEFLKMIPHLAETVVEKINELPYVNIRLSQIDRYIDFKKFLHDSGWLEMNVYTSGLVDFSSWIVNVVLSVVTSVYILTDRKSLAAIGVNILSFFIDRKKLGIVAIYVKKGIEFSYKYLFCVIVDAIIVFSVSFAVMSVMKIKYAPVLALMLGLFNIVPYFGAIAAGAVCVLTAIITSGFSGGVILGVVIIVILQIDANVIQPHLINESLNVKPFWVLVGILVGGYLFGIWGIIAAVPLLALIKTIVSDLFEKQGQHMKLQQN